ncbi:MAG: hypothetical protein RBJ76_13100 [Stenomitos frigidus ULC029]
MKLEDLTDLETLDAAIAKTGLSDQEKLALKLDAILLLPNLHQPFLDWVDAYIEQHKQNINALCGCDITAFDSMTRLKYFLEHLGLEPESPYLMKLVCTLLPLQKEYFPDFYEHAMNGTPLPEAKPLTLENLESMEQDGFFSGISDRLPSFSDVKSDFQSFLPDNKEAMLHTIEAVCLHSIYQPMFIREAARFSGCDAIVPAVNQYLEAQCFTADHLRQARLMLSQNNYLMGDLYFAAYKVQPNHHADLIPFDFLRLDSLADPNNSAAMWSSFDFIVLSIGLQRQFLRRVNAAIKETLPMRTKLKQYFMAFGAESQLAEAKTIFLLLHSRALHKKEMVEQELPYFDQL